MKDKKILVCLKYCKGELNPFDASALECALLTGSKDITVLAMAPKSVQENLKGLTRLGVKAVLVTDMAYAGSDTLITSLVLEKAIKGIDHDLIFCGRQSIDGDTAQVPLMLAKRLGYQVLQKVVSFDESGILLRSGERVKPQSKTVLTFERIKNLRFPSIFSKAQEVKVLDNTELNIPLDKCGINASPTAVLNVYESTVGKRECKFIEKSQLEKVIKQCLSAEDIENKSDIKQGEKLDSVLYFGDIKEMAQEVCQNAIEMRIKDESATEVAEKIKKLNIKTLLFSDDDNLKKLASELAVILDGGLCADCIGLRVEKGKFIMTRPAHSASITADIICKSEYVLATLRTIKKGGSDIIVSIGNGASSFLDRAKEFAKKLGAEVCASRTVVDNGIMPYSAQVGLTGKRVSPKVYIALGVSGAVQHTCAISGAKFIIAVNKDKDARIFDYADYGVIADIKDLI